jgi:YVTN family beta-propeller protein
MRLEHLKIERVLMFVGMALLLLAGGMLTGTTTPAAAQTEPTPMPLYALPLARVTPAYSNNTLALTTDTGTLIAANMFNNSISLIAPTRSELIAEIFVGRDPRSVAVTLDNTRILVANRGDGTLSVVDIASRTVTATIPLDNMRPGSQPYGVATDRNDRAFVTLQGSDELVVVDLALGRVSQRIPVPDAPTGLSVWGDFVYVTHFWSGQVSLIYLPEARVATTISTGVDTGLSQSIEVDIVTGIAYLPQTRSNAQNMNLTYDSTVFPVVNVLDLRGLTVQRLSRISPETAVRPVNMPFVTALDRNRNWLYVANAGSNDVSVIDLNSGIGLGNIDVGANPRGMLLNRDASRLYVHNTLDGTISIIDTTARSVLDVLPISNLTIPVDVLIGAQLFHSAADPRLAADGWISCATCHFDGQSDGRVWRGFPEGPRNTPVLYNLSETPPYNWSGTWDEVADVELKIRWLQAGTGLIDNPTISPALGEAHAGLSLDLDTLSAYLNSLQGPPNPMQVDDELRARGEQVFAEQGCAECHSGPAGTDLQVYDVETGDVSVERIGTVFDTPTLRWLWVSAPYFHDGSAATLIDVFERPGKHQLIGTVQQDDIAALVAYLLSWPGTEALTVTP